MIVFLRNSGNFQYCTVVSCVHTATAVGVQWSTVRGSHNNTYPDHPRETERRALLVRSVFRCFVTCDALHLIACTFSHSYKKLAPVYGVRSRRVPEGAFLAALCKNEERNKNDPCFIPAVYVDESMPAAGFRSEDTMDGGRVQVSPGNCRSLL